MHVHFITIKVSIVRGCTGQIQSEGGKRHDANLVTHHAHLVQRGLTIEDDDVAILDVSFHFVAIFQVKVARLANETKVQTLPVVPDDVLRARMLVRAVPDQLVHPVDVERGDDFRIGHVQRDRTRHADFVDAQVGIGGDDGTRREVDTLAHQIASDAPFFTPEPLLQRFQWPAAGAYGGLR